MRGYIPARVKARMTFRDFGAKCDGIADDTSALQRAFNSGLPVYGAPGDKHRVTQTIKAKSGMRIYMGWAEFIDDIQVYWPEADAGRAAPMIDFYGVEDAILYQFKYSATANRATKGDAVPTPVLWIGDNRMTDQPTSKISVADVKAQNCAPGTLFVSIAGDTFDIDVRNVDIYGGCSYGINIEYGKAPTETDREGKHPYNVLVKNFNGYDNPSSVGFLRTASCYNIKFLNCYGRNVKTFIYAWTGDRSISRVSQNVVFENVVHHATSDFLPGVVNYCATVACANKDGSTGEPLPAWTNLDHLFTFNNVELQNNKTQYSAGLRFYGTQGLCVFNGGLIQGSYFGVRAEPSANPSYVSNHSLEFNGTVFKENTIDAYLWNIQGVQFNHTKHKDADGTAPSIQMHFSALYNKINGARFSGMKGDQPYVAIDAGCNDNQVANCSFDVANGGTAVEPPLSLSARTRGSGNVYGSANLTKQGWSYYGLIGQAETMSINMANVTPPDGAVPAKIVLDASKRLQYECQVGSIVKSIGRITGGKVGDEVVVQSITQYADVTFENQQSGAAVLERIIAPNFANAQRQGLFTARLKLSTLGWVLA
jgi:hypothetical protein